MSKRELIEPHKGDKRYIRRNQFGRFVESVSTYLSLSRDDRVKAKHVAKTGEGDRGDEHRYKRHK
ncbi:MAG: hypothetical protein ABSB12_02725 [Candidatus Saccharimonadales bacterium]